MLAEVDELDPAQQVARRPGDEHLPPVSRRAHPRSPMHVHPHVPLRRHDRLSGMDAHTHFDRALRECRLRSLGGGDRVRGARESNKESIPLRIHLDPSVAGELVAQRQPVLREDTRVALVPELGEKPRRALDVSKQKGDGASGKSAHTASFLHSFGESTGRQARPSNPAQHPPGDPASCHPCDASRTGTSSSPARSRRPRRT